MIWILIAVLSRGDSGFVVTNIEFNTLPACQVAAAKLKEQTGFRFDSAICAAKGEKK